MRDYCQITLFILHKSESIQETNIHIQIPPTGYVGLLLRSTAVATANGSTVVEGTLQLLHA